MRHRDSVRHRAARLTWALLLGLSAMALTSNAYLWLMLQRASRGPLHVTASSAYMLVPFRVHLRDVAVDWRRREGDFALRAERVEVELSIASFLSGTIRARSADLDGVSITWRGLEAAAFRRESDRSLLTAALVTPSASLVDLQTIRIDDLRLRNLRRVDFGTVRFRGDGSAHARSVAIDATANARVDALVFDLASGDFGVADCPLLHQRGGQLRIDAGDGNARVRGRLREVEMENADTAFGLDRIEVLDIAADWYDRGSRAAHTAVTLDAHDITIDLSAVPFVGSLTESTPALARGAARIVIVNGVASLTLRAVARRVALYHAPSGTLHVDATLQDWPLDGTAAGVRLHARLLKDAPDGAELGQFVLHNGQLQVEPMRSLKGDVSVRLEDGRPVIDALLNMVEAPTRLEPAPGTRALEALAHIRVEPGMLELSSIHMRVGSLSVAGFYRRNQNVASAKLLFDSTPFSVGLSIVEGRRSLILFDARRWFAESAADDR